MSDDVAALLLALATENAELRQQLATAQDMLMETAIDAGHLHARIEALQVERDAWQAEAERLARRPRAPCERSHRTAARRVGIVRLGEPEAAARPGRVPRRDPAPGGLTPSWAAGAVRARRPSGR